MPGTKRKSDEDPWIVAQTKKFKAGLILANVYEGTLAQLRLGARNFFQSSSSSSSSARVIPSTPPSSPCSIADLSLDEDEEEGKTPSSPVIRDVVGHQVEDKQQIQQVTICGSCALEAKTCSSWDKCYYCEMTVCHVSPCQGCKEGFCGNCCITKYDNPSFETYSCYTCLSH